MVKCCVPMCHNASYRKTPEIAFHRFPKDEHLRNAWVKNINRKDWQPNSSSVICSEHFEKNILSSGACRTVLAPGAIPTIFKEFKLSAENNTNEEISLEPSSPIRTATGDIVVLIQNPAPAAPEIQVLQPNTSAMFGTPAVHLSTDIISSRPQMQMAPSSSSIVTSHARKTGYCCSSARDLRKLKQTLISKNKSLKALREKTRRLKKKVAKFSDVITELKGKLQDEDFTVLKNIPVNNNKILSLDTLEKAQNYNLKVHIVQS